MTKKNVPTPPSELEAIDDLNLDRLNKWIEYFRNLSSRISVTSCLDEDLETEIKEVALQSGYRELYEFLEFGGEDEIYYIFDFPDLKQIAFIILVNSGNLPNKGFKLSEDGVFVFCFNDFAFGLNHFELKDNDDLDYTCYSIEKPKEESTWNLVTKEIKNTLERISKAVPELEVEK